MSLTDPRATLVSKSQQRGLGRLQNATYVRGVPVFGTPCPTSPSVIFNLKSEQLHRSVLHQFIDAFVHNNASNRGPKHPKAGGGPEDTRLGPEERQELPWRGPASAPDTRNHDYNSRHAPGHSGGVAPASRRAACRDS